MNIVFVRTPRYIWPFNSETSAFWQPLGFMTLAGHSSFATTHKFYLAVADDLVHIDGLAVIYIPCKILWQISQITG